MLPAAAVAAIWCGITVAWAPRDETCLRLLSCLLCFFTSVLYFWQTKAMRHEREARIKRVWMRVCSQAAAFGYGHKLKDRGNYLEFKLFHFGNKVFSWEKILFVHFFCFKCLHWIAFFLLIIDRSRIKHDICPASKPILLPHSIWPLSINLQIARAHCARVSIAEASAAEAYTDSVK